jgi:hypothetical protein
MRDVIEMAREAGFDEWQSKVLFDHLLEQFAELVRADERALATPVQEFVCSTGLCHYRKPQQEPVAWQFMSGSTFRKRRPDDFSDLDHNGFPYWKPLYTTPPAAPDLQAELEATNRQVEILSDALAESRQQRQWTSLTDDEIYDSYNEPRSDSEMVAFAREVEAKLKEKNT